MNRIVLAPGKMAIKGVAKVFSKDSRKLPKVYIFGDLPKRRNPLQALLDDLNGRIGI